MKGSCSARSADERQGDFLEEVPSAAHFPSSKFCGMSEKSSREEGKGKKRDEEGEDRKGEEGTEGEKAS